MRVNPRVFNERTDMFASIQIPNCSPDRLKTVCENIMNMITKPGYKCPSYNKVSELDKLIALAYWGEYDGLDNSITPDKFGAWYRDKATEPAWIGRGLEWLRSHHYIILPEEIESRAQKAHENMTKAMRG